MAQTTQANMSSKPLLREQILHTIRADLELAHRVWLYHYNVLHNYRPDISQEIGTESNSCEVLTQYNDFCNKITPIYMLQGDSFPFSSQSQCYALLNHLYTRWYTPDQDIEYCQFIGKIIFPTGVPTGSLRTAHQDMDFATRTNAKIVRMVERVLTTIPSEEPLTGSELPELMWVNHVEERSVLLEGQRCFTIHPLFRATAIVIRSLITAYCTDVGSFPVLLVLTGNDEKLTAPITLENLNIIYRQLVNNDGTVQAVETTLDAAIEFLMFLNRRESTHPLSTMDPLKLTPTLPAGILCDRIRLQKKAQELGWIDEMGTIIGPSSQWIHDWTDESLFPCENWLAVKKEQHLQFYREAELMSRIGRGARRSEQGWDCQCGNSASYPGCTCWILQNSERR